MDTFFWMRVVEIGIVLALHVCAILGFTMIISGGAPILVWTPRGARAVEEDLARKMEVTPWKDYTLACAYDEYQERVGALWFVYSGYIDRLFRVGRPSGR
jgi:hypothetical protein